MTAVCALSASYSAHLYAALCEDVAKLMKRAIKLYQKYSTKLYAEESYDRENLEEVSCWLLISQAFLSIFVLE